jgi:ABC-type branched-subunit amino acid transport system ATPase component/predicted MFS family arabinose efflux permease
MSARLPSPPGGSPSPRQRVLGALRHPSKWLADLTGGGPVYALMILFGLNMVSQMDATGFGILIPNIRDAFHMTNAGVLSLVAAAAVVGLSLQVPIAQVADRRNRIRLMLLGAGVFAAFVFGTGLAISVWMLVVMRSGTGVGQATVGPTHNSLIADWYPINSRPRVYAFHFGSNAIGALIGPILAGTLAAGLGWRAPFFAFSIPAVILILLGLRLRDPSRGIQERMAMGVTDALETEEPPPSFAEGWRMVWKVESLRRIFYALPFLAASLVGFAALASILYQHKFGLGVVERGWVAAAAEPAQLIGLAIGARVGGRLIQRDPGLILRFLAAVALVTSALLVFFALVPILWVTIVINMAVTASLAAVGSGIYASLSLAIPARSRSLGFSMGAVWVIPGLIVLPIIGAISDSVGVQVGMLALVPVFLVGGGILSTAGRVIDRDIVQVRTMAAARSEVFFARRQGLVKLLLVRDLNVSYGQVQVLFDVNFEVEEGEIIALLGTNGAGKSTLLKAICGIVEADKGAVIFDGRDITHMPPNEIAALGITQAPGGQGVFPGLSVADNLRVAGWLDRRHRTRWATRTEEALELFPVLADRLDEPAANLSGGQQQMLALSMAFLARPRLLLIDELSLGLAPVVVEQLLPVIEVIRSRGTTVILVEQSVNLALTIAQTAYFMEKGAIKFHGPTAELLERPDILRSVFLAGARPRKAPGPDSDRLTTSPGMAARIESPLASQEAEAHDGSKVTAALQTSGLTVRFGGIEAVDGVSLTVAPGEIVGVIGPNGAGKTTLFDLISGFTRCDAGTVVVGGYEVTGWSPDRRARLGLGRSFQDARLFPDLTVEDTIAVALDRWIDVTDPFNPALHLPAWVDSEHNVRRSVDELIELFNLESFRSKFIRELSTGSRRVVDLACVVAHRPSVVLLDEPSSGIAQRESEALGPLLLQIRDTLGASLVVIEHDMPLLIGVADRMIALDQGRLLVEGSPHEVLSDPLVVASYLGVTDAAIVRSGALGAAKPVPQGPVVATDTLPGLESVE